MALQRKAKVALAIAVVLAAGGGGTYFYIQKSGNPQAASTAAQQSTTKVTKGEIKLSISGTSQFQTERFQNITAPSDGTIKTMNLTRTQSVKQGDVLFEISNPTLESSLQEAETSLLKLQTELAELMEQQRNLRIAAPASGVLTLGSNLDVGSSVNTTTKVGTIADTSVLKVKLPFLVEHAEQLKVGESVDLTVSGYSLTKTGVIQKIGTAMKADASGKRIVDVEITIENDGTLDADKEVSGSVYIGGLEWDSQGSAALDYVKTTTFLANTSGTIMNLGKKTGEAVKAGELIAVVLNDSLATSIQTKRADVERQQANLEKLRKQVDELTIRAPFDGVFSTDFADQKTNVLANYPVGASIESGAKLGAVASLDVMTLPVQVDELDLLNVKPGLKAEVTVDAISGKVFEAEVSQVSSVGVTTNGVTYYDAILSVPNPNNELRYGMTATAEIMIQQKKDILVLPLEALQFQRGNTTVMLKKADGSEAERTPVKVGLRSKTQVEITEGLSEGDEVVIPTRQRSADGSQQDIERIRQMMMQGGPGGGAFPGGTGGAGAGGGNRGG
ncbi:efflux RND transporter periplasmic adaptor subunit [Paenibacillus turpanensis]|uniref:efflux RND transporter periplasmic adaptor subunit n=1 Tax=Paenibacillus turpanensis TaxID=2689078 RepID=UPI00140843C8|nr:efflux RND transporter periplasmic adaptor subunit [Paenibacillus turpanensis]